MKIPRIGLQHVMASLQVTRPLLTYVLFRTDVGGRRRTRSDDLDGSAWAHNPKVGGSNPPPATKKSWSEDVFGLNCSAS